MSTDCIFCRIVAGEIPCHKVYEDDQLMAFLDIHPLAAGHTLLIPKKHYGRWDQCPEALAAALAVKLGPLAKVLQQAVHADSFNVLCNNGRAAGQLVDHVHVHIIPRQPGDDALSHAAPRSMIAEDMRQLAATICSLVG